MQDFPDNDSHQTCTICLLPLLFPLSKLECDHTYCFDCLQEWCKSHNTCPLCSQTIVHTLKIEADGTTTQVFIEYQKEEKPVSFDCLDHAYFKQEISMLLRICYELEVSRFKQRNSKGTPMEWRALISVKSTLEQLKRENEGFVRFQPEELLERIYKIKAEIDDIKTGNVKEAESLEYHAEEEYYEDEDYEDDYQ